MVRAYHQAVRRRQATCIALTSALRHQLFARAMVFVLARAPGSPAASRGP